jgi:hypothetical protein
MREPLPRRASIFLSLGILGIGVFLGSLVAADPGPSFLGDQWVNLRGGLPSPKPGICCATAAIICPDATFNCDATLCESDGNGGLECPAGSSDQVQDAATYDGVKCNKTSGSKGVAGPFIEESCAFGQTCAYNWNTSQCVFDFIHLDVYCATPDAAGLPVSIIHRVQQPDDVPCPL